MESVKLAASVCQRNSVLLAQIEKQQPGRVERRDPGSSLHIEAERGASWTSTTLLMKGQRVSSLHHCPASGLTRLSAAFVLFASLRSCACCFDLLFPSFSACFSPSEKPHTLSQLSRLTLSLCVQKPNYPSLQAP